MKEVSVQVDPLLETRARSKEELVALFEKEVDDFSNWMQTLPDWKYQGPLTRPERVILLTYLMQKHSGAIDGGR